MRWSKKFSTHCTSTVSDAERFGRAPLWKTLFFFFFRFRRISPQSWELVPSCSSSPKALRFHSYSPILQRCATAGTCDTFRCWLCHVRGLPVSRYATATPYHGRLHLQATFREIDGLDHDLHLCWWYIRQGSGLDVRLNNGRELSKQCESRLRSAIAVAFCNCGIMCTLAAGTRSTAGGVAALCHKRRSFPNGRRAKPGL